MPYESFFTPADVLDLEDLMTDAFATGIALQDGGFTVAFSRYTESTDAYVQTAPQLVEVEVEDGIPTQVTTASGSVATVNGWLSRPLPFDVEVGDTFGYGPAGDEQFARVLIVTFPELNVVRAGFSLATGES